MKNRIKQVLLVATAVFVSTASYAASIGVNFSGDSSSLILPPDLMAGAVPQTNWNNVNIVGPTGAYDIEQDVTGELQDNAASRTAVKLQYSANDSYYTTNSTAGTNALMLAGTLMLDSTIPPYTMTLTLTGLGSGPCDVYLYGTVDTGPDNLTVTIGSTTKYWQEPGTVSDTLARSESTSSANYAPGNYVAFTGVTPVNGTITISVNYGGAYEAGISGLQVVSATGFPASTTPPPPTYTSQIGVQFTGDNNSTLNFLAPTDPAGVAVQTNWNVINIIGGGANPTLDQGTSEYLQDDSAQWTQVAMQYHGDQAGTTGGADATPNDRLMTGQIMQDTAGNMTLSFTNLSGGPYDVYVYGAVLGGPNELTVQVSGNANTYYWIEPPDYNGFFKQATNSINSGSPGVGNYLVFSNVPPVGGAITLTLTEVGNTTGNGVNKVGISALQLCSISSSFPAPPVTIQPQPVSQEALPGRSVTFSSGAVGTPPFAYQWQYNSGSGWVNEVNGSRVSGATNASLSIANLSAADAIQYRMIATDATANSVTSSVVSLTLDTAAVGLQFSGDNTSPVNFLPPLAEAGALAQTNWSVVNIIGGGADTNIDQGMTSYLQNNAGTWTPVQVQYQGDDAWSTGPTATYNDLLMHGELKEDNAGPMTLTISGLSNTQYTVYLYGNVDGGPTTMSVAVGGNTYYWQEPATYGGVFTLATNSTDSANPGRGSYMVLHNLTPTSGAITISLALFSGGGGAGGPELGISALQVVSPSSQFPPLALTVIPQPVSVNGALDGTTVTFTSGGAGGKPPYHYQWQFSTGGTYANLTDSAGHISGSTSNILTIQNLGAADAGSYRLRLSDANFPITPYVYSDPASLSRTNLSAVAVNFSGDGQAVFMAPGEVAGVVPQPNWNNVDDTGGGGLGALSGTTPLLTGAQGTVTSARLMYNANDAWYRSGAPNNTPNAHMMYGEIKEDEPYSLNPINDLNLTFTNLLPGTNYEIYLYGAYPNAPVTVAVTNQGTTYYWSQGNYAGTFVQASNATSPSSLVAGNYMHFTNTADANGVIRFDLTWVANGDNGDGYYYFGIAGVQLIAPIGSFAPTPVAVESQPLPSVLYAGRTAVFYAGAVSGYPPITYQWQKFTGGSWVNVTDIPGKITGATTDTLTISNVTAADALPYRVVVTDGNSNTATSQQATLSIASAPAANTYAAWVVSKNPLAYYRLNETSGTNLYDYVGDYNGLYQRNALIGQPGVPNPPFLGFETTNTAMESSNGLQRTSYADLPLDLNGMTNLTFTMWVYPIDDQGGAGSAGPGLLMDRITTGGGDQGGGLRYGGNGGVEYQWNTNATGSIGLRTFATTFGIPTNMWSFVSLVISSNGGMIYVYNTNGMQSATDTYPLAPGVFNTDWHLGNVYDDANVNQTFDGLMDEVAVFGSSLSSNDIAQLYTAATSATTLPQPFTIQRYGSNVVLTWTSGTLLQAPNVNGPWTTNSAATSPYTNSITGSRQFFKLLLQ